MTTKNVIILGAVALGAFLLYKHMTKPDEQTSETKSNIGGSGANAIGPCSGSMATPENCKKACEQNMGGTYDGSSRMCVGAINGAGSRLFGGITAKR